MTAAPAAVDASARQPARLPAALDGTEPAPLALLVLGGTDRTPVRGAAAVGLVLLTAANHAGRGAS